MSSTQAHNTKLITPHTHTRFATKYLIGGCSISGETHSQDWTKQSRADISVFTIPEWDVSQSIECSAPPGFNLGEPEIVS